MTTVLGLLDNGLLYPSRDDAKQSLLEENAVEEGLSGPPGCTRSDDAISLLAGFDHT
jgi:hypothetical protein